MTRLSALRAVLVFQLLLEIGHHMLVQVLELMLLVLVLQTALLLRWQACLAWTNFWMVALHGVLPLLSTLLVVAPAALSGVGSEMTAEAARIDGMTTGQ